MFEQILNQFYKPMSEKQVQALVKKIPVTGIKVKRIK